MPAQTFAPALLGINGKLITVDCDVSNGLPGIIMVGMGDKAITESRERIRSAIRNSGFKIPPRKITLSLAPADLPKDGSGYDLALAIAILAATKQLPPGTWTKSLFLGELGLDGSIRSVNGAQIACRLAQSSAIQNVFIPKTALASIPQPIKAYGHSSLKELVDQLKGHNKVAPISLQALPLAAAAESIWEFDLADIQGQPIAKRALEIAATGGHNLLLSGPPGTGKSLLARALPGILPALSPDEADKVTRINNLAGNVPREGLHQPPFRAPHSSISIASMIGGGSRFRPGEISLAHSGTLFLDELPEFHRDVLESLRQPLENGFIQLSRGQHSVCLPAQFQLIAAQNPCPCGHLGDSQTACTCNHSSIKRYQDRISPPLLDRFDIAVTFNRNLQPAEFDSKNQESSRIVRRRVVDGRDIAQSRFRTQNYRQNARIPLEDINKWCKINNESRRLADQALAQSFISMRGLHRTIKVARTIADLSGSLEITLDHFAEALQYRPRSTRPELLESPARLAQINR